MFMRSVYNKKLVHFYEIINSRFYFITSGKSMMQPELILNNSVDITFMIGVTGEGRYRFISVNNAFCQAAELRKDQVEGKWVEEVIPADQFDSIVTRYDQAIRERQTVQWENTANYPAGRRTDIISITPVFNEQEVCTMLVGTVHDITERIKAEEKIRSREKQLDLIYNTVSDVIFLLSVGPEQRFCFSSVNSAFLDTTGLTRDQVEGKWVDEIVPEPSLQLVLANYRRAIEERRTIRWEETTPYPAGSKTGIVTVTPVFDEDGVCNMLVGAVHDITEQKKAQEEKDRVTYSLGERIKELTTLYKVSQLLQSETAMTDEVMQSVVDLLPAGWQFSDITAARIVIGKTEFRTSNYAEGPYHQSASFRVVGSDNGMIEVVYLEEKPAAIEGPFLVEERNLLNMVADMLQVFYSRRTAEEQLLRQNLLLESIMNSLPGIFYLQEITGEFIRWNTQLEVVTGYNAAEISKLHPLEMFDEEGKKLLLVKSREMYKNGSVDVETEVITKDKQRIPHYFTGQLIEYEGRTCIIGMGIDITEQRKAAAELLKQKELLESLINSLPGIFYLFDISGEYLLWNKNHETVPGYSAEEMKKMFPLDFFEGEEKEMIAERIGKVFTDGYAEAEANFMGKNGSKTPYYFNGILIDYDNRPCLMGVGIDMTERKKMEFELREAEIKFRTLVEGSQVGVYILQQGRFIYVNPRFCEIVGYTHEELLQMDPVTNLVSEEHRAIFAENIQDRSGGEAGTVHYEVTGVRKNGSSNRIEFFGTRTIYGGQPTIIGTMVDITERKLAEEALQKSEANLHTVFNTTDTIYVLLDTKFRIVSYNQRAEDFVRKELKGRVSSSRLIEELFPEERRRDLRERMETVLAGESLDYESSYVQPGGSTHWYHVRMIPISANSDAIFGLMIAVSDITEKKRLEQKIMDQKVQEQKKMTRAVLNAQEKERNKIGQELHDNVNQILVGAKMFLGTIKDKSPGNTDIIRQSIGLVDNAINEIRALTREQVTPQRQVDLRELIQSLVDNMKRHTDIEASLVYDIGDFVVKDDLKINIYRIVQEGINNILKHAEARKVSVVVRADGDGLHVVITDDGRGFSSSMAGTRGVGITNILNRVESYNGRVFIESQPGPGCKIDITVPI
jgi:PAS domain S-box-containing protein